MDTDFAGQTGVRISSVEGLSSSLAQDQNPKNPFRKIKSSFNRTKLLLTQN
jgi:hypothetical protein